MKISKRDIRTFERLELGVELDEIYDARGQRPCHWKGMAKEFGCEVVISDPCKYGHRFRTRRNSCIECNPTSLVHLRRNTQTGYVYGAWSEAGGLVKIGCTTNLRKRMTVLRSKDGGYNECSDWEYIFFARFENMGRTENIVLSALKSSPSSECDPHSNRLDREVVVVRPSTACWHFSRIMRKQGGTESWKHSYYCRSRCGRWPKSSSAGQKLRVEVFITTGGDIHWVHAEDWCTLNEIIQRLPVSSDGCRTAVVETEEGWEVIDLFGLLWCETSGGILKGKHSAHPTKHDALTTSFTNLTMDN